MSKVLGEIFESLDRRASIHRVPPHQTAVQDMSVPTYLSRPAIRCLQHTSKMKSSWIPRRNGRSFATTVSSQVEASIKSTSPPPTLDPSLVSTRREERKLIKTGVMPIGSRRRRAALQNSNNIPFEQLPYQCFQEARKILQADREEKLKQITVERWRIEKAQAAFNANPDAKLKGRLLSMQKYLEELKILADINDPMIKKRFEDGEGIASTTTPGLQRELTAYSTR